MKSKSNWPILAVLAVSFLLYGWRGFLVVLYTCVMLTVILILLSSIVAFFTSDFRRLLIEEKYLSLDSRFIKFFCKYGMHTWGEVVEDKPKTTDGALMEKVYRLKYGERKSLCCNQQQVVSRLLEGKHWGKLDEKYYGLREDCRK